MLTDLSWLFGSIALLALAFLTLRLGLIETDGITAESMCLITDACFRAHRSCHSSFKSPKVTVTSAESRWPWRHLWAPSQLQIKRTSKRSFWLLISCSQDPVGPSTECVESLKPAPSRTSCSLLLIWCATKLIWGCCWLTDLLNNT